MRNCYMQATFQYYAGAIVFDIITLMFYRLPVIQRLIGGLFLLSLAVSLGFGYFHVKNMGSMDIQVPGCPFMIDTSVVCSMNPLQHIEAWQHLFTAIPSVGITALILLLSALALCISPVFSQFLKHPRVESLFRIPAPRTLNVFRQNYLQEIFSQGILNPKLF